MSGAAQSTPNLASNHEPIASHETMNRSNHEPIASHVVEPTGGITWP
jgi:hypothetical protein